MPASAGISSIGQALLEPEHRADAEHVKVAVSGRVVAPVVEPLPFDAHGQVPAPVPLAAHAQGVVGRAAVGREAAPANVDVRPVQAELSDNSEPRNDRQRSRSHELPRGGLGFSGGLNGSADGNAPALLAEVEIPYFGSPIGRELIPAIDFPALVLLVAAAERRPRRKPVGIADRPRFSESDAASNIEAGERRHLRHSGQAEPREAEEQRGYQSFLHLLCFLLCPAAGATPTLSLL